MKTYKSLKEDIGLTTGAGIANPDLPMGKPVRHHSVYESLGICKKHMVAMKMVDGKLTCKECN